MTTSYTQSLLHSFLRLSRELRVMQEYWLIIKTIHDVKFDGERKVI